MFNGKKSSNSGPGARLWRGSVPAGGLTKPTAALPCHSRCSLFALQRRICWWLLGFCSIRQKRNRHTENEWRWGPAKGCGAGGSVWRRLSVVRKSEAQADGTWVDTRTTTPTPTRSATISANAVGVYRGIFLRAASGTLTAPSFMNIGTRTFMRIFIYEKRCHRQAAGGLQPADAVRAQHGGRAAIFGGRPCGLAVGAAQGYCRSCHRGLQGHGQRSPLESAARRCLR